MAKKARKYQWKETSNHDIAPAVSSDNSVSQGHSKTEIISLMAYGSNGYMEQCVDSPKLAFEQVGKWPVLWINVDGLANASVIREFGELFGLHPLAVEDVINLNQRAKVEAYDDFHFIVVRMVAFEEKLETQQVCIFLGHNVVLTFQELQGGDCFDQVRQRIRRSAQLMPNSGPDYLMYSLIDAIIDGYFPVLEKYGEILEDLEDEIIERPNRATIGAMHRVKRDLIMLRRSIWPVRDAINILIRENTTLITNETRIYLRDCYDHAVRLIDLTETYRELGSDLMDVYLSSVSNRLNEVMKVLTIITVIFIPPTFIAGVYGMNFRGDRSPLNMPELNWYFGYPAALTLMAIFSLGMLLYIKSRGWLDGAYEEKSSPNKE